MSNRHHNPEDDWESIDPAFIAALTDCTPAILFVLAFIGAIITH